MKLKNHLSLLLLAAIAFAASCSKTSVKKSTSTSDIETTQKQQAVQMAMNLYHAVTGAYGGANISNGLAVSSAQHKAKGLKAFDVPSLCGSTILSTTDSSYTLNDTLFHTKGQYLFTYTCDTTTIDGYKNNNQFYNTSKKDNVTDSTYITQNFNVAELNGNYNLLQLTGEMTTDQFHFIYNNPPYQYFGTTETTISTEYNDDYNFTGLTISVTSGTPHISGGSATFSSTVKLRTITNWADGVYDSTGTISYEGWSNEAIITAYYPYNQRTFTITINLLTGQIVTN